ncbi:palmitoyl-protein thioesterase 1-like [Prorops nasuta]|uniref:palmitoyl-protein thioesterase 1-like n=1 Tax=Prorops nasuta TaxID=863751 RepID=UPI0034CFA89B
MAKMDRTVFWVKSLLLLLFINNCYGLKNDSSPIPVVVWHGLGDSCCFSFSMGRIKELIEQQLPGVYTKFIRIGNNEIEDMKNSYFYNVNKQIDMVCNQLALDDSLKYGYNAIGFSQGSQFLRAIAQRCPVPQMLNLISLGGQHQGIYGTGKCVNHEHSMCDYVRRILTFGANLRAIQEHIVPASYWHDPHHLEEYKHNIFLADINNELSINQSYKKNLMKLKKLVLVKFLNDTIVVPRETEWFGFYKPGQSTVVEPLEKTALYKENRLGLQEMRKQRKIHFYSVIGDHLQFSEKWFIDTIINQYLK